MNRREELALGLIGRDADLKWLRELWTPLLLESQARIHFSVFDITRILRATEFGAPEEIRSGDHHEETDAVADQPGRGPDADDVSRRRPLSGGRLVSGSGPFDVP